jgi:ribonuclease VapC
VIVDTSALVAILKQENDAESYADALAHADELLLSAANYLETSIVIDGQQDPVASRQVDNLITKAGIEIATVTAAHAKIARAAYRDFGRGSGHPAKLNFGDCFAYALATALGEPLLFKGDDFIHTDVTPALEQSGMQGPGVD